MEKKGNTIARYLTAIIGLPLIILGMAFANTVVMDIAIAVVSIISMYEYFNCFKITKKANPSQWLGYTVCIMVAFIHIIEKKALFEILLLIIPISLLVLFAELVISEGKKNIVDVAVTIFGICYIPFMMIFLSLLRASEPNGKILAPYILCASWGSDVFAYLIGKHFGKHKFNKISPHKTMEGAIAGIIGATLVALAYTLIVNLVFHVEIAYLPIAAITIVLSIIGQIGDLAASSIKRYCGIKDFSELLPGHGGMLDRIDSLIFICPFAFILLLML